jgi:molybdenum cofactor biosynthesis enzyme
MDNLTHTNNKGEAQMVDVADKNITTRIATASCLVLMKDSTLHSKLKIILLKKVMFWRWQESLA